MSMNIYLIAHRKIKVLKTNKIETQIKEIDVLQTPTNISRKIMASNDKMKEYKNWIKDYYSDDLEYIKWHLGELYEDIKLHTKLGYELKWGIR